MLCDHFLIPAAELCRETKRSPSVFVAVAPVSVDPMSTVRETEKQKKKGITLGDTGSKAQTATKRDTSNAESSCLSAPVYKIYIPDWISNTLARKMRLDVNVEVVLGEGVNTSNRYVRAEEPESLASMKSVMINAASNQPAYQYALREFLREGAFEHCETLKVPDSPADRLKPLDVAKTFITHNFLGLKGLHSCVSSFGTCRVKVHGNGEFVTVEGTCKANVVALKNAVFARLHASLRIHKRLLIAEEAARTRRLRKECRRRALFGNGNSL